MVHLLNFVFGKKDPCLLHISGFFHYFSLKRLKMTNYILLLFSCSVVSDSLWLNGLQLTRLPCPSPSPRLCSNSCPLSPWCHPTISSSVVPFSSCLQSSTAWGSFLIRWPKFWSFSFSISPSNEYSGLTSFRIDWFHLAVQGILKSLLQHHSLKASTLQCSAFFMVQFYIG